MRKITRLQKNLKSSYLFIVTILSLAFFTQAAESPEYVYSPNLSYELEELIENTTSNNEKLDLDLFVMSYCPYGIDAELAILPYVKEHQDKINLNIYYIANEMTDGSFESLHGEKEVEENLRQLVIKRLYPDKYLDYILLRGEDIYNKDLSIISKSLDIDIDRVNLLINKEESLDLLRNNILISRIKEVNASPTLFIDNTSYSNMIAERTPRVNCRDFPDRKTKPYTDDRGKKIKEDVFQSYDPIKKVEECKGNDMYVYELKKICTYSLVSGKHGGWKGAWVHTGDKKSLLKIIKNDPFCINAPPEPPEDEPGSVKPKPKKKKGIVMNEKCWGWVNGYYTAGMFDGEPCDDGDECTKNDHCVDGQCVGDPKTSREDSGCGGK